MDTFSSKKRSILLLAAITVILGVLAWLFYHKVSSMLDAETQRGFLRLTERQATSFEKSLTGELAFLSGVAEFSPDDAGDIDWAHIRKSLESERPNRFAEVGAVNLQGEAVIGLDRPIGRYQGLQQAFRGYASVTAVPPDDGGTGFFLAAPVMHDNNVRYALYAVIDGKRLGAMMGEALAPDGGVGMIFNDKGEPVLHAADPAVSANVQKWHANPEAFDIADNFQNLHNKVKRYKKGVERFVTNADDDFYLGVVPLQTNEWRFVHMAQGQILRSHMNSVGKLFLMILGGLLLLFLIVLAYLHTVDASYKDKLFSLAYSDRLTGLPNWEKVRRDLSARPPPGRKRSDRMLVSFDIKGFKFFNEMYGYQRGDNLLNQVAQRLEASAQGGDIMLCRYENDCFAYVAPRLSEDEARRRILARLAGIAAGDELRKLHLKFSCGACVIPAKGARDWNAYMDAARIAREQAKKSADTTVEFFDDALRDHMVHAQRLRADLDEAIANDDFLMYLQPKFAIAHKGHEKIIGAEALVRWRHRERGMLAPNVFIPVFEEDGSIEKLDRVMFEKACAGLSRWMAKRRLVFPVSVNLSRVQLSNPNLVRELSEIADAHGAPRRLIDIELTESASFGDMKTLLRIMHTLKDSGFKISLDDFGTGYSSLSMLRDMPMDVLKLDRSFIEPLRYADADARTLQFVRDIIRIAENLGIQTLAEGVETERQLDILRDVNCDMVQGYYFSRPVPIEQYENMVAATGSNTFVIRKDAEQKV